MNHTLPPVLEARLEAFAQLGRALAVFATEASWPGHSCGLTEQEYQTFDRTVRQAYQRNGWFTPEQVRHAAKELSFSSRARSAIRSIRAALLT